VVRLEAKLPKPLMLPQWPGSTSAQSLLAPHSLGYKEAAQNNATAL